MVRWEEGFGGSTIDPIFPPERRFDSTKQLVDYIDANEDRNEELLNYLLKFPENKEIATLATELSSCLVTLKSGVATKHLDSVGAGI